MFDQTTVPFVGERRFMFDNVIASPELGTRVSMRLSLFFRKAAALSAIDPSCNDKAFVWSSPLSLDSVRRRGSNQNVRNSPLPLATMRSKRS